MGTPGETGRPFTPKVQLAFFIVNLLVRVHFIIVMMRWTGLAPWQFEFLFPGSLTVAFQQSIQDC